jgi:hypothetical protein
LVAALEPWEDVDMEVFDEGFDWTVAITHERELIYYAGN